MFYPGLLCLKDHSNLQESNEIACDLKSGIPRGGGTGSKQIQSPSKEKSLNDL